MQQQQKNQEIEDKFFESQLEQQNEELARARLRAEKEAQRNQMSQAQKDLKEDKCECCGMTNSLVTKQHEGTLVCQNCGVVSQVSMIDQSNEKRNFSSEQGGADSTNNRVNASSNNPFLPSQGLSTTIAGTSADAKELNKQHYQKIDNHEKNISEGIKRIKQLGEALNLKHGNVMEEAMYNMKKIEDSKELRGKSLEAKVAVAVFVAARKNSKNKKMDEIQRYVSATDQQINTCYKKCKRTIFKDIDTRIRPADIVERTCNKLNWAPEILHAAKQTANNFTDLAICEGKKPQTIAGVSLIMVKDALMKKPYERSEAEAHELLQEIAEAVSIGAPTIRECYGAVWKQRAQLLPKDLAPKRAKTGQ